MKYMLLIHEDQAPYAQVSQEEQAALYGRYMQFTSELRAAGKMLGGEALQHPHAATTVRVQNGQRLLTDGPYAETKEQLGGFYLIDVPNIDEAVAVAERICRLHTWNHAILEVRPVMDVGA